ncbi:hypothetical protein L6R46_24785 [Myxococcota bacterium]|nr:hypothetical protein [Myxococcota bacterium]
MRLVYSAAALATRRVGRHRTRRQGLKTSLHNEQRSTARRDLPLMEIIGSL